MVVAVLMAVGAGGIIETAQAASTASAKRESSQLQARAAFAFPLVALMVCSRVCPPVGIAAAKILRRAPKQIKPSPALEPALANAFTAAAGSSPSTTLGTALAGTSLRAAALRARGLNAHHIVAIKDPRGAFAREVLQRYGIGPNSAANGVWLEKTPHQAIHTNAYYANVNAVVGKYYWGVPANRGPELVKDLARVGKLLGLQKFPL